MERFNLSERSRSYNWCDTEPSETKKPLSTVIELRETFQSGRSPVRYCSSVLTLNLRKFFPGRKKEFNLKRFLIEHVSDWLIVTFMYLKIVEESSLKQKFKRNLFSWKKFFFYAATVIFKKKM